MCAHSIVQAELKQSRDPSHRARVVQKSDVSQVDPRREPALGRLWLCASSTEDPSELVSPNVTSWYSGGLCPLSTFTAVIVSCDCALYGGGACPAASNPSTLLLVSRAAAGNVNAVSHLRRLRHLSPSMGPKKPDLPSTVLDRSRSSASRREERIASIFRLRRR